MRILIQENSAVVRKIMFRLLGSVGYQVNCVETAEEFVQAIRDTEHDYDGFVVDMCRPDYMTAIAAIREFGPSKPCIAASRVDEKVGEMVKLRRLGIAGFIAKPFDRHTLTVQMAQVFPCDRIDAAVDAFTQIDRDIAYDNLSRMVGFQLRPKAQPEPEPEMAMGMGM